MTKYAIILMLPTPYAYGGKVVKLMFDFITAFLTVVGAEVAASFLYDYIRNWLNRRKK